MTTHRFSTYPPLASSHSWPARKPPSLHDEDREMSAFLNRVRSLFNIDGYLLPELDSKRDWPEFRDDPPRYFINRADPTQCKAIWREVEKRQRR
jgi:hypothetical protein